VKGTIDSLDWLRKWLHNHGIITMSWYSNKDSFFRKENEPIVEKWEWEPTNITITIFIWIL
jgi:hypothetical protein